MSDTLLSSEKTDESKAADSGDATDDIKTKDDSGVDDKTAANAMYDDEDGDKKADEDKSEGGDDDKTDDDDKADGDEDTKGDDDKDKSDDDKKEDDKKEDDEDDKDEDKEPGEPLDLSDLEIDLPEGMELNQEALTDLGALTGELNLSKEDATRFVPVGVKLIEADRAAQAEGYETTRGEWRDTTAADKEIGWKDETEQKKQLAIADRGLNAIGTPELRTLLNQTGLGDNPEVIRAFYKAGLAAGDDVVEQGGSGDTSAKGLDEMYPTMAENK